MPVGTSSLSIKALPLEVIHKERNTTFSQMLSPSSILPTTSLFKLHISTNSNTKLKYEINVQQSNNLMQRSGLFYDLSTQYNHYASQTSLEDHLANSNGYANSPSLEDLAQEANGLPMLCIELPNIPIGIIEDLLQWLFNNTEIKADDILASTLASNIQSTSDFFSLLNFITLLDLFEPYCSVIDEILVWYYFGLNAQERNVKILRNESFVNGNIPARFVKRLAESVGEFEEKQILSSFFKSCKENSSKKVNEWELLSLTENNYNNIDMTKRSRNILEWLNSSVITPSPRRVTFSLPNSPSPLDNAEPPTPLGSAYFCISPPPNTPSSPTFQRILPRSLPSTPKTTNHTKSNVSSFSSIDEKIILERDDMLEDVPLTAGLSVPPNTPNLPVNSNLILPNTPNLSVANSIMGLKSPINNIVPPNTPNSPANIIVPPNTPNSLATSFISLNSPATPSFFSPLAPPNTPNTPSSPVSISSYHTAVTINGLLSPTSIPFSPSSPTSVPPNSPTSPFIFQSITNNIYNYNIGSSFNNNSNNKFPRRKNSREKNVTIDSVLANSLNTLSYNNNVNE